jgi:hypothetical protein
MMRWRPADFWPRREVIDSGRFQSGGMIIGFLVSDDCRGESGSWVTEGQLWWVTTGLRMCVGIVTGEMQHELKFSGANGKRRQGPSRTGSAQSITLARGLGAVRFALAIGMGN